MNNSMTEGKNEKRRDKKGRILHIGEYQNDDGRYVYKYCEPSGKRQAVYSWRLTESDPLPKGKRDCKPLRELEKEVQRDIDSGILTGDITVLELIDGFIAQKQGIKPSTRARYISMRNSLSREIFSRLKIADVRPVEAKTFLLSQQAAGKRKSTIKGIKNLLFSAFKMAVSENLIRTNPMTFTVTTLIKDDEKKEKYVRPEDEKRFLEFIKKNVYYKKYYDPIYILFHTGLRISEFAGLTVNDIDFEHKMISVNHQVLSRGELYIETPKTKSGQRRIPITPDVEECLIRILEERKPKAEVVIDGYSNFIFCTVNGTPRDNTRWGVIFREAVRSYNRLHDDTPLPMITPHMCRHTYCTNMAMRHIDPKTLQYLMGHSNISMTLDYYTHFQGEEAVAEVFRVMGYEG